MGGAWHVILINKKDRTDRVRLKPGEMHTNGFKVVNVVDPTSRTDATVEIQVGAQKGSVMFDPKYLTVKAATPKTPGKNSPKQNTGGYKPGQKPPIPGYKPKNVRKIPTPSGK